MSSPSARVLVTGANGNLGRALLLDFADRSSRGDSDAPQPRAAVRSERAARQLADLPEAARPEAVLVDYANEEQMSAAAAGCGAIVHLVGIIKEGSNTSYEQAHERSCAVLARAAEAAGASRIVYLSIVGSNPESRNACLASKGRAEQTLLSSRVPTTILRVPMVLGRGDYASAALRGQTRSARVALVGGGRTLQQPIDVRDVVRAIVSACRDEGRDEDRREGGHEGRDDHVFELAGPECLSHRALVERAALLLGRPRPGVIPIPLVAARTFATVVGALLADPPLTPAMLGVLQHDDRVDPGPACKQLGVELTPLDETLRHCLEDTGEERR